MSEKREYKECYVAIIDLLGFKNMIKNKSCEEIAQYYDEIHIKGVVFDTKTKQHIVPEDLIEMRVMSDTICFFIDATVENALAGLTAICCYFQARLLSMNEPILSRGAIVKGEVYSNGDVLFGNGIVEAYLLEENIAKFPRIILTEQTFNEGMNNCNQFGKKALKIHVYQDDNDYMAVDSLLLMYNLAKPELWSRFENFYKSNLGADTNESVREKYRYIEENIPRVVWRSHALEKELE